MKTTLNIKNFRVFDDNGVTIEVNPITILTGGNSSGKSTLVKATFLLNSFLSQIKRSIENGDPIELNKYKLDFTKYPNNLLGRFDKVIHEGSNPKTVTMEYTMHSLMLSKEVSVQLVFSADENDILNNAFLDSIKMSTDDGMFYFSSKDEQSYCNLNIIKKDFITFILAEEAVAAYWRLQTSKSYYYDSDYGLTEDEHKHTIKAIGNYLRSLDRIRCHDSFRYLRTSKREKTLIEEMGAEDCNIAQLQGKKSIFSIPVIDKLSEMSKSDVEHYVMSELVNEENKAMVFATRKIISDFLKSDFDNFADYFANFEKSAFEQRVCTSGPLKLPNTDVHLLSAKELSLHQEHLYLNFKFEDDQIFEDSFGLSTTESNWENEIKKWKDQEFAFDLLYEVVMVWNKRIAHNGKGTYVYVEPSTVDPLGNYYHTSYKLLCKFVEYLVQEIVCPNWCSKLSYVGSDRATVSRLYTLDNNDDFSLLIQNYFEKRRNYLGKLETLKQYHHTPATGIYEINSFMNRWVQKFEIGNSVSLDVDNEGLGVQIRLHKADGDAGRILADEGYGITQLVSILLQIETAILTAKCENYRILLGLNRRDGYNYDKFHYEVKTIAIEEPEIHLHPQYQSMLVDMFMEAYEKFNIHFIIETHSEYMIRRAQVIVASQKYKNEESLNRKNPFKVYYVPRNDKPYDMVFKTNGRFVNSFGPGFYDKAGSLALELYSKEESDDNININWSAL